MSRVHRRRFSGCAWAVIGLVLIPLSCHPVPINQPNVLLIVVDTLRADRLGAYGSTRGLTPFIDSLAARGFVFQNAFASSPWTNPSVASLVTSRHTWQHAMTSLRSVLPQNEVTLAEVLRDGGYATAGWSANPLLRGPAGWGQGHEHYVAPPPGKIENVDAPVPVRAEVVNRMAVDWWHARSSDRSSSGKPGYLYLQYMEPHPPYAPPEDILKERFRDRTLPDVNAINGVTWIASLLTEDHPARQRIEDLYDLQVRTVDRGIARLFAELEDAGFLQNAIIVLTADHGEGIWDHGAFGHGGSLFDELIRVPLLMLIPGQSTRVDIDEIVSHIDVAPTLLDLVGIPRPASFEGRSRVALLGVHKSWSIATFAATMRRLWAPIPEMAFSDMALTPEAAEKLRSSNHRRAVMIGQYKLIARPNGHEEFFNRSRDPLEIQKAQVPESVRDQLRAALAAAAPALDRLPVGEVKELDPAQRERLRALGYTE